MQTVLIVDDDPSVRDLISIVLEYEGFSVLTAADASSALAFAQGGEVDAIAVDGDLEGVQELLGALRADPGTASIFQVVVGRRVASGGDSVAADATLAGPFDLSRFVAALRAGVGRSGVLDGEAGELDEIIARRLLEPVFQPIVDLETREVVAVEGLIRGPHGPLASPHALFRAAQRHGRLAELDSLCRLLVLHAALDQTPHTPPLVTVNVEPGTTELPMSDELRALLEQPLPFRVVTEFTERALTHRTSAVMRHAEEIRQRGNVVALDDLGVDRLAVAMLHLVQPEVVKLDGSLLRAGRDAALQSALAAAGYAERTGAVVIAEHIETEADRATALALGATWGQGYLFAPAGPMRELAGRAVRRDTPPLPRRERVDADRGTTAFGIARASGVPVRRGDRRLLLGISRQLEAQGQVHDVAAVVVAVQDVTKLTGRTLESYHAIAPRTAVLGILGVGVGPEPVPGSYGVDLAPSDPLAREWVVAVVAPGDAVLLCARPVTTPDAGGEWEFCLTRDQAVAHRVARLLTLRLVPRDAMPRTTALADPLPPRALTTPVPAPRDVAGRQREPLLDS